MDAKLIDLNLPEWVFCDDNYPKGGKLEGRTVVLHVRSATVLEIFHGDDFVLNDEALFCKFSFKNSFNAVENITIVVHYCATLDISKDRQLIIDEIVNKCAAWYLDYLKWEDKEIIKTERSKLN